MERKPDMLRAALLIFAVGLVISGITSIQASEGKTVSLPAGLEIPLVRSVSS